MLPPITIDPLTFFNGQISLPPLSPIALRIQTLTQDPNADIDPIAELINSDPALLAQVLKIVNSTYFGLRREITDAHFATAFLGLGEVSRIALALSVINALRIGDKKDLHRFWYHSFYAAICAKSIARKFDPLLPLSQLWSAAMLHDIGKLVYLKFFPDHYRALLQHSDQQGCLFSEAEEALGFPASAEIGTLLCLHWKLPTLIRDSCRIHTLKHLAQKQKWIAEAPCSRVICLANLFAILTIEVLNPAKKEELMAAMMTELGVNQETFLMFSAELYDLKQQAEGFIQSLV